MSQTKNTDKGMRDAENNNINKIARNKMAPITNYLKFYFHFRLRMRR